MTTTATVLEARLAEVLEEKSLLKHPFYRAWTQGTLPAERLQEYARQYFHFEAAFPRFLSALHSRVEDPGVRQLILENLWDEEYGERNPFPFFCDLGDATFQEAVRRGRREEFARFAWGADLPDPLDAATFASAKLSWAWPDGTVHAGLRRLYRDLLHLRRAQPALRDFRHRSARVITSDNAQPLLVLTRGKAEQRVTCVFNLGSQVVRSPSPHQSMPLLLHSEDACYRGEARATDVTDRSWLRPFECLVLGFA